MKYYKNLETSEIFGYDETYPNDEPLIQAAIDAGWEDVSNFHPPQIEIEESTEPTKEQLLAKLLEIQAQLEVL